MHPSDQADTVCITICFDTEFGNTISRHHDGLRHDLHRHQRRLGQIMRDLLGMLPDSYKRVFAVEILAPCNKPQLELSTSSAWPNLIPP